MSAAGVKTVLMTGGTGFLGSNLLRRLVKDDSNLVLLKRSTSDISRIADSLERVWTYDLDKEDLGEIFKKHKFDLVLHCATDYGRKRVDPTQLVEANLVLPLRLLQFSEMHNVPAFINTDTILDKRVSHYSLSKRQFFDWLTLYSTRMSCVNVALEHFYGPNDDETKFVSNMVQSLLKKVDKIDLTPGEQRRDFIYIDDVVDAFMRIIGLAQSFGTGLHSFEVGSGKTIRIRDLLEMIQRLAGNNTTRLNFGVLPYRENEVMESKVNLQELWKLGWKPSVSLEEGLKKTIEFAKERSM